MAGKHKIAIIGPSMSGKTQLHGRLIGKTKFSANHVTRAGDQIGGKDVQYWDFRPDASLEAISSELKTAHKICLAFKATDSNWMQKLNEYLHTSDLVIPVTTPIILVGTHADQLSEQQQTELAITASRYAQDRWRGAEYVLVSAQNDFNIPTLSAAVKKDLPNLSAVSDGSMKTGDQNPRRLSLTKNLLRLAEDDELDADQLVNLITRAAEAGEQSQVERLSTRLSSRNGTPLRTSRSSRVASSDLAGRLEFSYDTPVNSKRPSWTNASPSQIPPVAAVPLAPRSNATYFSFALRLAGMALMLAAITGLVYLALVAASLVSATALTTAVNSIVVTVGGLFGMATPAAAFSAACAALGVSTVVGSNLLAASAGLVTFATGYGLNRWGQPTVAAAAIPENAVPQSLASSMFSFALRMVGLTVMLAALANLVYLLLIATNVLSAVALASAMNYVLVTAGGVLGFSAPAVAFGNACASWGISTTTATTAISAASSMLVGLAGYGVFRSGKPAAAETVPPTAANRDAAIPFTPVRR